VFGARDSWNEVASTNELSLGDKNTLSSFAQPDLQNAAAEELINYNVFHILQETGSSTGPQGNEGDFNPIVTVVPINEIDCTNDPIPIDITLTIDPANYTSIVENVQIFLTLTCPSSEPGCDADSIGTISLLQTTGLTLLNPVVVNTQTIDFEGPLAAVQAALDNVVYNPPAHSANIEVETNSLFLVEASITAPAGGGTGFITAHPITVRQPANVPYIYPVDVQSFNNLSGTVNSTVVIPPIAVSDLVSPTDLLYVSIDPTNTGRITLNTTANLTMVPVNPAYPQVVAFVGQLEAVNDALANILFTPNNCTGLYCITRYGFFIIVKDLANNSICPDVAVILCELEINANNDSTIFAALPAPELVSVTNSSVTIRFRSTPPGYNFPPNTPAPHAYAVSWSANPNTVGYRNFVPNPARNYDNPTWQYYTSPEELPAGTTISLIVGMINTAGLSTMSSPPLVFTTQSTVASRVSGLRVEGFTSSSITFSFNPVDQPDITGYVAGVNTSETSIVMLPISSERIVYVLRGLSAFTPYKISVAARNVYGVSPKTEVTQWTKLQGPQIVGFVASDPQNDDNVLNNGDQITISFDIDTNRPSVATKADLDRVFFFSQNLGASYSGSWVNARTCVVTLNDVTGSDIALGVLRAHVIGSLYDANEITDISTSSSPLLVGNWGTAGLLDYFQGPSTPLVIQENEDTYLGVTGDDSLLDAASVYTLTVQILSPLYTSSRLSGRVGSWSEPSVTISFTGPVANLSSALASVLYSPARQYSGPVSFQFTLGTNDSATVAVFVNTLTITSVNHAPVIIKPERAPAVLNTWSAVANGEEFITINDVDVAIDSTTDLATVTLSASSTGMLRFVGNAQVGVSYSPAHGVSAGSLQITGPLYALNYALSALQVNFEYETSSLASPADYIIAIEVNDNANGGSPALSTYGLIHFTLSCPSSVNDVLGTAIESISFTSSGNQLLVLFTLPVSDSVLVSPAFDCGSIFTSQSVALFGSSPSCRWTNTRTIEVTLGLGTTVTVNSAVSIRDRSLPRCANGEPSTGVRSALARAGVGLNAPIAPVVSISGPEWASACRALTLTGEVFHSSSHAVTYNWNLPPFFHSEFANIQPVAPSSLSTPFLIINSSAFSTFANPPSSYTFILTVTDFMGQMSKASYEVSVDRDVKPFITPISQAYTRVYRDEPLNLFATADLPNCGAGASTTLDRRVTYSWTVSPAIDGFDLPSASNLFIPANILSYHASADHQYVFTLRATMTANPSLYTEQHFVVEVLLNALQPRIAGGDVRSIKSISAFTVDASGSYDIDASSFSSSVYQWSWTCAQAASFSSSSSGCYDINGSPLVLPSTNILSFEAGSLIPNEYVFTVSWWHPSTNRMGTAAQKVRVVEFDTPADISVDTASLVINSFDRVGIQTTANGPTNFTLSWSTATSSSNALSYNASSNNLFLNNERAMNFFEPGATYKVTAVTTDVDGLTTSSSLAFYVNRPPICSQLSVSPSSGMALDTHFSFLVASADCYDPDADPRDVITFQYFRVDSAGRHILLTPSTSSNLLEHITLPAGGSVVVGVRISDRFGAYSELTTTVSVASASIAPNVASFISTYDSISQAAVARGDAPMTLNAINNIIVTASAASPALSAADMSTLKDHVLSDLFAQASASPDALILQSLSLIFADVDSISTAAVVSTLDYINSISVDSTYVPSILNAISQFIIAGSSTSGSGRRLLAVLDSATLTSLITSYIAAVNSVLADYSMNYLTFNGDIYRFNQASLQGAIYRAGVPVTADSYFTVDGSTVVIPSNAFPAWTSTNVADVALYSVPENFFSFLAENDQVSDIFNVVAFVPAIQVSPYVPRSVASRQLNPMPVDTYIPVDVAFDATQATNCLNTPVDADNVCTLECRMWDASSSSFVTTGVSTDYAGISSTSNTVRCAATGSSSLALFKTVRNPTMISSTGVDGSSGSGTGSSGDSDFVRVSVELTVSSRAGFRSEFIQDIAALTGQNETRFDVEQVIPNDVNTRVIFVIRNAQTATSASSLDVYESLRTLTLFDVLSTTYVRYADLNSWQMQCPDLVYRAECTGSSAQAAWMLPVVIVAAVLGLALLCCVAVVCVRRYRTIDSKDKGVEETMPGAIGAKQFFYTPNEPEATPASVSEEVESDVTIVGGVAETNNATADDEEVSEPIVVENEAVAAAIAKLPMSGARTSQRTIEEAEEEEYSVNSRGSLSESHFVYVDESKRDTSRSSVNDSEFSRSGSSASTSSHFRVPVNATESASREVSSNSRRSSSNSSAMHFRYSDDRASEVSTSRTPSLPHLNEPHSPSHSSRRSQNVAFSTNSDNGDKPTEKKAIRVVRPGQH
jgi:hypothetical protein